MSTSKLITKTTEGFAAKQAKTKMELVQFELEELGPYDIHVKISHCGICHSDLHLINNDWQNAIYPLVPGHEIIGTIVEKGTLVNQFSIGDRVGIGWQRSSCNHCEWCLQGEENLCLSQEPTCVGHPGGFAKDIISDSRLAFLIPKSLPSESAAPLLCGGATVFSPFLQHQVDATWRVGVISIGGLGHFALQFANAFGCEVTAFSSSAEKEKEAKEFGAHHFVLSQDQDQLKKQANSLDFIIAASSATFDFKPYLAALRPKGILCLVGAPEGGQVNAGVFDLIMGRKTICGSNIGSAPIIRKMLKFAALHSIGAKYELFPMSNVNEALNKLANNQVHYRAVLFNE